MPSALEFRPRGRGAGEPRPAEPGAFARATERAPRLLPCSRPTPEGRHETRRQHRRRRRAGLRAGDGSHGRRRTTFSAVRVQLPRGRSAAAAAARSHRARRSRTRWRGRQNEPPSLLHCSRQTGREGGAECDASTSASSCRIVRRRRTPRATPHDVERRPRRVVAREFRRLAPRREERRRNLAPRFRSAGEQTQ